MGTNVHIELIKSMEWNGVLDLIYMAKDGVISKRSIKILPVGDVSFSAYCYLRKSNRTFKIDNILGTRSHYFKRSDCYMMDCGKFPNRNIACIDMMIFTRAAWLHYTI